MKFLSYIPSFCLLCSLELTLPTDWFFFNATLRNIILIAQYQHTYSRILPKLQAILRKKLRNFYYSYIKRYHFY